MSPDTAGNNDHRRSGDNGMEPDAASSTVGANKALVRRFYEEVWNSGNVDFAYHVFADDYLRHDLRPT